MCDPIDRMPYAYTVYPKPVRIGYIGLAYNDIMHSLLYVEEYII